jgi:nicotinate phosphoribosyltransferase
MKPEGPLSLWPDPSALGALTDLYQLTMMAGYFANGMEHARATFELFVRKLPPGRAYLVFAGLEQAVGDLLRLRFSAEQVEAIRRLPVFAEADPRFFETLAELRFTGDVWAIPEGTIVFGGEPLIRVEAALPQAEWVETLLLASVAYPTLVASKAARVVQAARGRPVFDFGLRRGHGPAAGMLAARAATIGGCAGTSNVEAAIRLRIPCVGTMAHSWVQSFDRESDAFAAFARTCRDATMLVDTYDPESGVRHAAAIDPPVRMVRLDSGDLLGLSRAARAILDERGRGSVQILASGDLDEFRIDELMVSGAPIDAFGVGTELITSRDAPALSAVYKLVELDGVGRIKLSPGKRLYPMAKQVVRTTDADGRFAGDEIVLAREAGDERGLLQPVLRDGQLVKPLPSLEAIRAHCRDQLAALPDRLRALNAGPDYPVSYSAALQAAAELASQRAGQSLDPPAGALET